MAEKQKEEKRRQRGKSRRKSKSKTLDVDEDLKSPTQVRKEVKHLLLKAIDEAAETKIQTLKQLPRVSAPPLSSPSTKSKTTPTSDSVSSPLLESPALKSPKSKPTPREQTCPSCPFNSKTKEAFSKPYYSRDQFAVRSGHHTVTREYFTADGTPIASPSSKSMANPERLNTIVLENTGSDVTGMILELKLKMAKPDGTCRDIQLGIEIPSFD